MAVLLKDAPGNVRRVPHAAARRLLSAIGVALGVILNDGGVDAQVRIDSMRISDSPTCAGCSPRFTLIRRYGLPGDPHIPHERSSFAIDSRGRAFVTSSDFVHVIVYDSAGRYVTALGQQGTGPGEIRRLAYFVVGPGDSLYVVGSDGRVAVYSPALRFVRGFLVPSGAKMLYPDLTGRVIVAFNDMRVFQAGWPLHVTDSAGRILSSFGATDLRINANCLQCVVREPVRSTGARYIWLVHATQYRIERWSRDGQSARVLIRKAAWFPPRTRDMNTAIPAGASSQEVMTILRSLQAFHTSVAVDGEERIWTRFFAFDHPNGLGYYLEIVDSRSGDLLYSGKDPGAAFRFVNGDLAVKVEHDSAGYVQLALYRVELVRSPQGYLSSVSPPQCPPSARGWRGLVGTG